MEIPVIKSSDTTFGYKMPTKKTYRAMKGFYELRNDKSTAVEYGMLHNDAMARLHYRKFQKLEKELEAFSDKFNASGNKLTIRSAIELAKIASRMTYEKLASARYFYSTY
ncbi:hypothetical protein IJ541_08050 [bacterium]|nr:hypothetical protein [bacterium]